MGWNIPIFLFRNEIDCYHRQMNNKNDVISNDGVNKNIESFPPRLPITGHILRSPIIIYMSMVQIFQPVGPQCSLT